VLENPAVAVKSGDTATIFSGAKVPFAVSGENGQITVQYEEVGVKLDVTPFAQGNDVDLNLKVEVSSLGEIAPSGYQLIDTSNISTSEYCRAGESIVIGGLQRLSDRIEYNRVPEGGEETGTPLFTLYKSKDYKKSKSQFLVFITPQVYESSSEANGELQDKFNLLEVRQ
jgi:Flp pilus assembly secretin CpaC